MAWSAGEDEDIREFLEMEKILRERRGPSSVDRERLRDALKRVGLGLFKSLVVHAGLGLQGRGEEEITREYLFDLHGELSAFNVLKSASLTDKEIMERARVFARSASAGRIKGGFPCMYIWGVKQP